MNAIDSADVLDEELAELEQTCAQVLREIACTHSVRETLELSDVTIPHHLKSVAKGKVHSLSSLPRQRDLRVDEVVKAQLGELQRERSEVVASREFDRLRACDWAYLRGEYPDLFNKAMCEGRLIVERKQKRGR